MMTAQTYLETRERLRTYFDAEAMLAWSRLTSDAKVSGIRETVRQGRERMREMILSWLPADLEGRRILDAGCGTGALAFAAAARGARVLGVDLAENLLALARERAPADLGGRLEFRSGDMLDPEVGTVAHAVFMDSLIHYAEPELVAALAAVAPRVTGSLIFTFAPRTPLLTLMWGAGRLFPRSDRAPSIQPVSETSLRRALAADPRLAPFKAGRSGRISRGFYTSTALELVRA